MKKKLILLICVSLILFQSSCSAFGLITSTGLYDKWIKLDNHKIAVYRFGEAKYVIETISPEFVVTPSSISFLADALSEGDSILVNGKKTTVYKITEI
ncbi:MAG: hypothetical protein P4N59_07510 [Negativicutes bacterium]|nr:hypothetical protein [Negativicutes bacterium]